MDYRNLGEDSSDLIIAFDSEFRYIYVNPQVEKVINRSRDQMIGKTILEVAPHTAGTVYADNYERAMRDRVVIEFEDYYPPLNRWNRVRCVPQTDGGLIVFARSTTRERRDSFLTELTERTRSVHDPDEIIGEIIQSVGEFYRAARCSYVDVNERLGTLKRSKVWVREGIDRHGDAVPLSMFSDALLDGYRRGSPLAVADIEDSDLSDDDKAAFRSLEMISLVNIPIIKGGVWVGTLSLSDRVARNWPPDDVDLLTVVAERTWLSVENARLFNESQLAAARDAYLAEASYLLNASLDYETTLATIARLAVPKFADWCVIDMVGENDNQLHHVALEHVNPEKVALGWELRKLYPPRIDPAAGLGLVLKSGKSSYIPLVTDEMLRAGARDEKHYQILCDLSINSVMIVPLIVRSQVFGALSLIATHESGRLFSEADLRLAEEIGRRAGLAIENSRLFQKVQQDELRQRRIADTLQNSLLLAPASIAFPGFEIDACYEAALTEAFIGGDYGDAFRVNSHKIALLVGDCSGKGLGAARSVGQCQFTARAVIRAHPDDPAVALKLVNEMLLDSQLYDGRPDDALTTLAIAIIDERTGAARVTAGGAEPPLLLHAQSGLAEEIMVRGPLLGIDADSAFVNVELTLEPGDTLVFLTDGITEARSPGTREFFGYDRLLRSVEEIVANRNDLTGVARDLVNRVKQFAGGVLTDDVCLVAARRRTSP